MTLAKSGCIVPEPDRDAFLPGGAVGGADGGGGPVITVPTITLEGDANGAPHPEAASYRAKFTGPYAHHVLTGGVGHDPPQEAPRAFADAVVEVDRF